MCLNGRGLVHFLHYCPQPTITIFSMIILLKHVFFSAMESDDDFYTVSECLSSKVSSYGSCTPVASDHDDVSTYICLISN